MVTRFCLIVHVLSIGGVDSKKTFLTYSILNTWRHVLSMGRGLTVRKLFLPTPCSYHILFLFLLFSIKFSIPKAEYNNNYSLKGDFFIKKIN